MNSRDADLLNAYRGLLDLSRAGKVMVVILSVNGAYRLDELVPIHPDERGIYWEMTSSERETKAVRKHHESEGRTVFDLTKL